MGPQTRPLQVVEGRTMVKMGGKRSVVALMLVGGVALADGFMVQPSSNVLSPGGDSLSSASRRSLGEGFAAGRRSTTAPLGREFADPRRQRRAGAACGAHAGGGSGGAEAAVRFIKRGAGGRPRLAVVAEKIAKAAMWILAGGKVRNIKVSFSARTNTDVIQGRLGRADLSFEEADGPILRGRSGALTSPNLDLRYKPAALLGSILLLPITGSFFLMFVAIWASLALVRAAPGRLSWSLLLANIDVGGGVRRTHHLQHIDIDLHNHVRT